MPAPPVSWPRVQVRGHGRGVSLEEKPVTHEAWGTRSRKQWEAEVGRTHRCSCSVAAARRTTGGRDSSRQPPYRWRGRWWVLKRGSALGRVETARGDSRGESSAEVGVQAPARANRCEGRAQRRQTQRETIDLVRGRKALGPYG